MRELPSSFNLRCFLAAAELLNFSRAARTVALTPSAFGQRIRQLEEALGVALFERTTRSVVLTAEGESLLPRAREAIRQLAACADAVHLDDEAPVRLHVATRYELGFSWVVPSLLAYERAHPHWTVETAFGSGPQILAMLEGDAVDAVVTSAPVAREGWASEPLHPETYAFVGAPTLLAEKPLHTPGDAAAHTLLDIDATLPLGRYLTSAVPGLAFRGVRRCGAHGAVHALALAGRGVAVLPTYAIGDDLASGTLEVLLPRVELLSDSFRLLFRENTPQAPRLRTLAAWMRERPLR